MFSTLHTNDAPSAITRLTDMGVENYLIASSLMAVLAQRLVRVICPECRAVDEGRSEALGRQVYRGAGCAQCSGTGYRGRQGIFEMMEVHEEIRRLVVQNADATVLAAAARNNGMTTLNEDGWDKVNRGVTTVEEVLRVTQDA